VKICLLILFAALYALGAAVDVDKWGMSASDVEVVAKYLREEKLCKQVLEHHMTRFALEAGLTNRELLVPSVIAQTRLRGPDLCAALDCVADDSGLRLGFESASQSGFLSMMLAEQCVMCHFREARCDANGHLDMEHVPRGPALASTVMDFLTFPALMWAKYTNNFLVEHAAYDVFWQSGGADLVRVLAGHSDVIDQIVRGVDCVLAQSRVSARSAVMDIGELLNMKSIGRQPHWGQRWVEVSEKLSVALEHVVRARDYIRKILLFATSIMPVGGRKMTVLYVNGVPEDLCAKTLCEREVVSHIKRYALGVGLASRALLRPNVMAQTWLARWDLRATFSYMMDDDERRVWFLAEVSQAAHLPVWRVPFDAHGGVSRVASTNSPAIPVSRRLMTICDGGGVGDLSVNTLCAQEVVCMSMSAVNVAAVIQYLRAENLSEQEKVHHMTRCALEAHLTNRELLLASVMMQTRLTARELQVAFDVVMDEDGRLDAALGGGRSGFLPLFLAAQVILNGLRGAAIGAHGGLDLSGVSRGPDLWVTVMDFLSPSMLHDVDCSHNFLVEHAAYDLFLQSGGADLVRIVANGVECVGTVLGYVDNILLRSRESANRAVLAIGKLLAMPQVCLYPQQMPLWMQVSAQLSVELERVACARSGIRAMLMCVMRRAPYTRDSVG